MSITCPACRKANDLDPGPDTCGRCGCDLARLRDLLAAAARCLRQSAAALRRRDYALALRQAEQSWALRHTREAAGLAFLAAAAARQTAPALLWRERALAEF